MEKLLNFKIHLYLFFVSGVLSVFLYDEFSPQELTGILASLQALAGVVFTISGLWIAVIYPEAIKIMTISEIELKDYEEKTKNIEILVIAMLSSIMVMTTILIASVIDSALPFEFMKNQIVTYRYISSFSAIYLCLVQLMAVIPVAGLSLKLAIKLHQDLEKAKANKKLKS